MTDSYDVLARLSDLERQSERRYMHTESAFLNEEEQALARTRFPESALIRYEGGYRGARKKKVIFLVNVNWTPCQAQKCDSFEKLK